MKPQEIGSIAFVTLTTIKISLVIVLVYNYFVEIPVIQEMQIYIFIYLGYLLIIPPLITRKQNQSKIETPQRKKFVTAKDELDKAVDCAADSPEDSMMYLRIAIDLAIQTKFGFTKILQMQHFISDAEKFNLPLPSYSIIYSIFNEGSKRLHKGKIHTSFEASQSIDLVTNFIAELEKMIIPPAAIIEFKKYCKAVS